jgi:hypothetical protein
MVTLGDRAPTSSPPAVGGRRRRARSGGGPADPDGHFTTVSVTAGWTFRYSIEAERPPFVVSQPAWNVE